MSSPVDPDLQQRREYLARRKQELEEQSRLQRELPHKYGWKWYEWAWQFNQSRNKYAFLCAGNQISKSSSQIRTCIEWATEPELWPVLWRTRPYQFWYLYPTLEVATVEFNEKWETEFLPNGSLKDHPQYGWKAEYGARKIIKAIHFNSGVSVYFKSYATNVMALQTSSAHAIFCDEELPEDLYPEINMRIAATDGYFRMVFTATLGQEFWRRVIEEQGTEMELLPGADKFRASMYDCLTYRDGTPSHWTKERIQRVIDVLPTQAEVERRVFGRFVKADGLKYPSFIPKAAPKGNIYKEGYGKVPHGWLVYAGVDVGSGGLAHPAAIVFLAVAPDFTKGRVIACWRGDKLVTTAGDVLTRYVQMREELGVEVEQCSYDWQSADFRTVADRAGVPVSKADKGDRGEGLINSLFKLLALEVPDDVEGQKLQGELRSLLVDTDKSKAKDDLIDGLRFAVSAVPWDFEKILDKRKALIPAAPVSDVEKQRRDEIEARRGEVFDGESGRVFTGMEDVEWEIAEFNKTLED